MHVSFEWLSEELRKNKFIKRLKCRQDFYHLHLLQILFQFCILICTFALSSHIKIISLLCQIHVSVVAVKYHNENGNLRWYLSSSIIKVLILSFTLKYSFTYVSNPLLNIIRFNIFTCEMSYPVLKEIFFLNWMNFSLRMIRYI